MFKADEEIMCEVGLEVDEKILWSDWVFLFDFFCKVAFINNT